MLQLVRTKPIPKATAFEAEKPVGLEKLRPVCVLRGFTLVSLLVAMSILVLLLASITQIVDSTSSVTQRQTLTMEADSQARTVFDRMGMDFAGMLQRKDVDYVFSKVGGNGNDAMFFYSAAPSYFTPQTPSASSDQTQGTVALVGYRVNQGFQLERLGKGLSWDGDANAGDPGSVVFLTYPADSTTPIPESTLAGHWPQTVGTAPYTEGTDTDYHLLADGVFRMEFCFLQNNGQYVAPTLSGSNPLQNVAAIVVTIGILDTDSRKIVSSIKTAANALPDGDGPDVAAQWNKMISDHLLGIPKAAATEVHVYQRFFYLNNN
jgi:type II secretory pathway pseudopilin PulG